MSAFGHRKLERVPMSLKPFLSVLATVATLAAHPVAGRDAGDLIRLALPLITAVPARSKLSKSGRTSDESTSARLFCGIVRRLWTAMSRRSRACLRGRRDAARQARIVARVLVCPLIDGQRGFSWLPQLLYATRY